MTKKDFEKEVYRFRQAIVKAKVAGEFNTNSCKTERMNNFPHDCCDDTSDLITHYLFQKYGNDSLRIDGEYFDKNYGRCAHSWQVTDGWLIDLTGDQFDGNLSVPIKSEAVYIGKMDDFHQQFRIIRSERSCGIKCLGSGCWKRMYGLYDSKMKFIR